LLVMLVDQAIEDEIDSKTEAVNEVNEANELN
jgi:hypothetical protein